MKQFHVKSFAAGILIGTFGITTAFAATGIQSAVLSSTAVTLNGASLSLDKPLISVTMENEQDADLYAPAEDLLGKLGYTVHYDSAGDTLDLIPGGAVSQGDEVIDLTNNANQTNIAESGSFQAEKGQTLVLNIASDIQGGTVDLFLFDPDGNQQRVTIGSSGFTREIALKEGIWQYNCSGAFQGGGNVKIVGTIKETIL